VGVGGSGTCSGLLELNGTRFEVLNSATIGAAGTMNVTLNGAAAGISVAVSGESAFAIDTGGKLNLTFSSDPSDPRADYWGLKLAGDRVSELTPMIDDTIVINKTALSSRYFNGVGVHYVERGGYTIIGYTPPPQGTAIMFK
jgi:hypothetical protein